MVEHKLQIQKNISEFEQCRILLIEGIANPEDRVVFCRGDMRCLTGTVGWFVEHDVKETPTEGPVFVKYKPFPKDKFKK